MAEAKISDALSAAARGGALTEVILNDGVIAGWGGGGPPGRADFGYWLGEAHQEHGPLHILAPAWVARLQPAYTPAQSGPQPSPQTWEAAAS